MRCGKKPDRRKQLKKYLRLAKKAVKNAEENNLDFDLEWLASLQGVIAWIELHDAITPNQIRAIFNAERAVRNIIRYKKRKEKRDSQRKDSYS